MKMRHRIAIGFGSAMPLLALGLATPQLARMEPCSVQPPGAPGAAREPEPRTPNAVVEAVSFARDRGALYVPVREAAGALDIPFVWDARRRAAYLADQRVPPGDVRRLLDGTRLVSLRALSKAGATVEWTEPNDEAQLERGDRLIVVRKPAKRVVVNLSSQSLRAWEGTRLVLTTRVSTGRKGYETPAGMFRAGPLKARMLISHKYDDAEMPWAVQVQGDVCIHGHTSIPRRAASHGCVRVPLSGQNPAKWLYDWIDLGTPIIISTRWPRPPGEFVGPPAPEPGLADPGAGAPADRRSARTGG